MMLTSLAATLLARLLLPSGTSLKDLIRTEGEHMAKNRLRKLAFAKVKKRAPSIAARLDAEGMTARDYTASRLVLYRVIKGLGVRGGLVVDALRDTYDDKVWAAIEGPIWPEMTALDFATRIGNALVEVIL